jgi:thiol-disulfide isomerase/thioredoxin
VYVDFWASWCATCIVSVPLLNEMRNRLVEEGKDFEILAVNVDQDPEDGIDFLLDEPVQYVTISDPNGGTPKSYEVKGMPTSFLVDAEGKIRMIHEGFKAADIDMIEAEVNKLLAEAP